MSYYSIGRKRIAVTIAAGETVGEETEIALNGILKGILLNVPALVGTTTLTLDILDEDGFTLYSKASIAEDAKTVIFLDAQNNPLHIPLFGLSTVKCTASNAQTGQAADIPVVLLVHRG